MAIITKAQVKTLLNLGDNYIADTAIAFVKLETHRLAQKDSPEIILISDAENSTTGKVADTLDYVSTIDWAGYRVIRRRTVTSTMTTGSTWYIDYSWNSYDDDIDALIPYVQADLVGFLNNAFQDKAIQYEAATIAFVNSNPDTITDSESQFVTEKFLAGMDIAVEGGYTNVGIYTIDAGGLAAGTLTLIAGDSLIAQTAGDYTIRISRVAWPDEIKLYVAQIIWANLQKKEARDIQSLRLGPSAITYMPIGSGGYSDSIVKGLSKWKNVRMK